MVEIVHDHVSVLYSRLFLVEKERWVKAYHRSIPTHRLCGPFKVRDGDIMSILVSLQKVHVLNRSEGSIIPDPCLS